MSLFVRVDVGFWQHRKTLRLRARLGESAFWIPPRLWAYAAQNQPDGDFSDYSAEEIASLIGYLDDAKAMLEALQQAQFMDGMMVHGWAEHNGYHTVFAERAKKAAAARWGKKKRGSEKRREEKTGEEASNASSISASVELPKKPKGKGYAVPACFEAVNGFSVALAAWIEHRTKIKKPVTGHAVQLMVDKLAERPDESVAALNMTMDRGWASIKWDWFDREKPPVPIEREEWVVCQPIDMMAQLRQTKAEEEARIAAEGEERWM